MKNVRDFCFWMRGVLDASQGKPTHDQWDLIIEHIKTLKGKSNDIDPCSQIVMMIWGFIQVAGEEYPTDTQWSMILEKTYEYLDQVPEFDSNETKKCFELVAKNVAKDFDDKKWPKPTGGVIPPYGPHFASPGSPGDVVSSTSADLGNWTNTGSVATGKEVGELIAEQC